MNCKISEAKSNYKKLGNYIQIVNKRDTGKTVDKLLGVSIRKVLIPSIANIIGTDMSTYKIIQKNQFAYGPVTSRNGDKISVALLEEYEEAIVSQAYTVFEVIDKNELLPEYLMMWFRRPEFDRYARFKSHGSAREIFDWAEMCDTELPIPSIEKQLEIVREYNVIQNRIVLNNQLISKLEEAAQTIYKQWFVDFEFPDENGLPYKSNGGEMVWCEELEKEIPEGWRLGVLGDVLEDKGYIRGPFGSALKVDDMETNGTPVYEQQHVLDEHRNFRYFISDEKYKQLKRFSVKPKDILISCSGVNLGKLSTVQNTDPLGIINQALLILRVNAKIIDSICVKHFLETEGGKRFLIQESGGSAQPNIAKREIIQAIPFLLPLKQINNILSECLTVFEEKVNMTRKMNDKLNELKDLLLAKMTKVETEIVEL